MKQQDKIERMQGVMRSLRASDEEDVNHAGSRGAKEAYTRLTGRASSMVDPATSMVI